MNNAASVMIILSDHDRRVRFRTMAEQEFGLTVYSVADPSEGLTILQKIAPPRFLLLSSQELPLMSHLEFLERKAALASIARIPVVLLATSPQAALPLGVVESVQAPIQVETLARLVKQYAGIREG